MGGFTCCVPGCYNNSKRERELRFYIFPKDLQEREKWLKNISRAGCFQPTTGHRVCSVHFAGGRKTYSIRVPTLFPQRGEERHGRKGKKVFAPVPTGLTITTNVVSLSAADTEAAAVAAAAEGDIVTNTTDTVEIVVEIDENGLGDYVHYVDDAGEEILPITPTLRTSS